MRLSILRVEGRSDKARTRADLYSRTATRASLANCLVGLLGDDERDGLAR